MITSPIPKPRDAAQARDEADKALIQAQTNRGHAGNLTTSDAFEWFLATCVRAEMALAQAVAMDPHKTRDEREIAVHVHAKLEEVEKFARETYDTLSASLTKQ